MPDHAQPEFASPQQAQLMLGIYEAEQKLAYAQDEVKEAWDPFLKAVKAEEDGKPVPVLLLAALDGNKVYKAGRYVRYDGAGTDMTQLANLLRDKLSPADWSKFFTEQVVTTTVVHANESALEAARALSPVIDEAIEACTSKGKPVAVKIPPKAATAEEVAAARNAASSTSAASEPRPIRETA